MENWIIYALVILWMTGLIVSLEMDKIRRIDIDIKTVMIVLIIIFFLGSAVASLFSG